MKSLVDWTHQRGATLVVALVMLLITTMMGLASIRGTALQERMAGNMYDRSLSFHQAEAALIAGEDTVLGDTWAGKDCTVASADCPPIPPNTFTNDSSGWTQVPLYSVNNDITGAVPQVFIERMGLVGGSHELSVEDSANQLQYGAVGSTPPDAMQYRITARSGTPDPAAERSVVALQVIFKKNL